MKKLISKELSLTMPRAIFLFSLCAVLVLIPNYPCSVGFLYGVISVFVTFTTAKTNKDNLFTAMLPLPRRDIVKGKCIDLFLLQLSQIIIAIPCAIIASLVISPYGNIIGLDANLTLFGVTLIGYSIFNVIFLPWHCKSGYKLGMPITVAIIAYAVFIVGFEILVALVPSIWYALDNVNSLIYQLPVLISGILIYFGIMIVTYRLSVKNFEKVSL